MSAIGWYTVSSLKDFYYQQTIKNLESHAEFLKQEIPPLLESSQKELQKICETFGHSREIRVTLISIDGKVLGDSEEDPLRMDNHSDRPEFVKALSGEMGSSIRPSKTLKTDLLYVAVPIDNNGQVAGVVRTSIPLTILDEALKDLIWKIILAGVLIALVATPISLYISRKISQPLSIMRKNAVRFAGGDFGSRIQVQGTEDVMSLAKTLNQMAAQLNERIQMITSQRNEQEAILTSMVEGVIAVDSEENVISINQAAAHLIGTPPEQAQGRSVQTVIRNIQLQEFVQRILKSEQTLEEDIVFHNIEAERNLQAVGNVLRDSQNQAVGAVIVLNDVTRLRRLETVRRDFVANVSHELKTPITSIKGFVETLLNGAKENPDDTVRFLRIVAKQADRLNSIIEDLLSLSRIEQDAEKEGIKVENSQLKPIFESAILDSNAKATDKNIQVKLECDPNLRLMINSALMEQAVSNLVDNAIKYSDDSSTVEGGARIENKSIIIYVKDQGQGIAKEHLPRLFERFYRVDKARSRKLGGTGLGLAIVKHIAQAHGGEVSVESNLGQGSTFKILLPDHKLSEISKV